MIDLSKYIYDLLLVNECVVVPGLGGFIVRKKNAVIYIAQNLFAPPTKHLHFNPQLTHNDGLLAYHISKEIGTTYEKSLETISETVSDILYKLYKGESVLFKNIGTISNQSGFLKFEPSSESDFQDESYGLNSFFMPMLQSERQRKHPIITHKKHVKSQKKPIGNYQVAAVITFLLLSIGGYFLQTNQVQDYVKGNLFPHISFMLKDLITEKSTLITAENIALSEEQPVFFDKEETTDAESNNEEMTFSTQETITVPETVETAYNTESNSETIETFETNIASDNFIFTPVSGQYYIIIGAFTQPNLAENLCKRMRANGYNKTVILDIPSSHFRRVSLQSFDNLASAQESLRAVKQIQEDAWVLKWKN